MTHAAKIQALKVWTRRIQNRNEGAARRRMRYSAIMAMPIYTDALRREAIALLVEGIDAIELPSVSNLKACAVAA